MLTDVARTIIEAALEAELVEHLGYAKHDPAGRARGSNSRNGSRAKVVRTVLGPLRIEVPRDRWGTFDPTTVAKWQRVVVGVDRVLLPLAAKNASPEATLTLLTGAYPADMPHRTLRRIATTTREAMAGWHARPLGRCYTRLEVRRGTVNTRAVPHVRVPFVSVVGTSPADVGGKVRRELLSLQATCEEPHGEAWTPVLADLQRRGVASVETVVGAQTEQLRPVVGLVWPGATVRPPQRR